MDGISIEYPFSLRQFHVANLAGMWKYAIEYLLVKSKIIFRRKPEAWRVDYGNHPGGYFVGFFRVLRFVVSKLRLVIFVNEAPCVFLRNLAFDVPLRRGEQIL